MAIWTDLADRAFKAVLSSSFVNTLLENVEYLKERTDQTAWVPIGAWSAGFASGAGADAAEVCTIGDAVFMRGRIDSTATQTIGTSFTAVAPAGAIPAGYRPDVNMYFTVSYGGSGTGLAELAIYSTGAIFIRQLTGSISATSSTYFRTPNGWAGDVT